jgi:aldose 1-epimerase
MIGGARVDLAGETSVGPVRRITIGQAPGPVLQVLDLGATMHSLEVTCGDGVRRNVLLGHATPQEYLDSTDYLGGTIGRYANRIAAGRFTLEGVEYQLGTHDRGNHLHGGPDGFDRRVWEVVDVGESHVRLRLESPAGDQGFPGLLRVGARFEVTGDQVRLDLEATTDAPTLVNLTSHAYVNLAGAGSIDDHVLMVRAERYTPVDDTGIPVGGHAPVEGTPFDLRHPTLLGPAVREPHPQVVSARGIDHNLVTDGAGLRPRATLECARSGLRMVLSSDQPGLQVYTGNFLDGSSAGTDGRLLRQGAGIALEPQRFPDTPNRPDFGSAELRPGETYRSTVVWAWEPTRR